MAKFSDLPNEILVTVLCFLTPNDIESFVLTAKRIYALSTTTIKIHNDMKRKYSEFWDETFGGSMSVTKLLEEVLEDQRIKFYVKKVFISEWWDSWNYDQGHRPLAAEQMMRLKDAAHQNLGDMAEWAIADLEEDGTEDPVIALLLSLLPNIQELSWSPEDDQRMLSICLTLRRIATLKGSEAPLAKLTTVCINDRSVSATNAGILELFASLPAVQELQAWEVYQPDEKTWLDLDEEEPSNIVKLQFTNVSIHPKNFFRLLRQFKALRHFGWDGPCWDFHTGDATDNDLFEPFWIQTALLMYARDTFESLTLLSYSPEGRWIGDLRGFPRLQVVHTELQLLLQKNHILQLNSALRLESPHDSVLYPSVASLLPETVRVLRIQISKEIDGEQSLPCLLFLWSAEKERMSGLNEIIIVTDQPEVDVSIWETPYTYDSLARRCAKLDVQLSMVSS